MRSILMVLSVSVLGGILAAPATAEAQCVTPCQVSLCTGTQTILEGSVISSGPVSTVLRIDRIHGIDDGSVSVGDTTTIDLPGRPDIDGYLVFLGPFDGHVIAIRSGEAICRATEIGLSVTMAIDIALSDDCWAEAEKVLGPIPECDDTVSFVDGCASSPGTTNILALWVTFALLAATRLGGSRARA